MPWSNAGGMESRGFTCGYCGFVVASDKGYHDTNDPIRRIYICPHCDKPSYIVAQIQVPGATPGNEVKSIPKDIESLYREARKCVAVSAFTASVLTSRKVLAHIAVSQGAATNLSFLGYVEHLASNGFVPPNGRGWVDHIRRKGNEATHEIVLMKGQDAEELISFLEMLLKFIYEFPSLVPKSTP